MSDGTRYVVQSELLGLDNTSTKSGKGTEYAIQVVLTDESRYTMYRSLKEILNFHNKLLRTFKVEAGYFKKSERVIPDCPIKQTIFGIQRSIRDDKSFEKLLNYYIKDIPALPAALVKSEHVTNFFSLKNSDLGSDLRKKKKTRSQAVVNEDSLITGPVALKSYLTISDYRDKKTKFSFQEGATVQVLQKDPNGWWMVDAQGLIGWAPASFMVSMNDSDKQDEIDENEQLIQQDRVGARYISMSAYQASRDDELSFVRGAIVKVLNKYVDGWWSVRYNGKEGFVPGAMFRKFDKRQGTVYITKIKRKYTHRGTIRVVPTVKPTWMTSRYEPRKVQQVTKIQEAEEAEENKKMSGNSKSGVEVLEASKTKDSISKEDSMESGDVMATMYCESLGDFEDNGLIIKTNDKVKILDDSGDDWWFVEDRRGKQGWAPFSYFQAGMENATSIPSLDLLSQEEHETFSDEDDESVSMSESEDCHEQYIVTVDYSKSTVDELDVIQGQLVCVIDDSEEDLWYVNADGKEGWLPSNVLQILTDNNNASGERTPSPSNKVSSDENQSSDDDGLNKPVVKHRSRIHKSPSPQPELARKRSPRPDPSPNRDYSESEAHYRNSTKIDNVTKQLQELEKDAEEAEMLAKEARKRAQILRDKLNMINL